jgi:hypothetical protein
MVVKEFKRWVDVLEIQCNEDGIETSWEYLGRFGILRIIIQRKKEFKEEK